MDKLTAIDVIRGKYETLKVELDERGRRIWAAVEANVLGHGGVAMVAKATGISVRTIKAGRKELKECLENEQELPDKRRVRRKGGGRKPLLGKDSEILSLLKELVDPTSRGDPMSPLRVGELLDGLGFSLQSTRKRMEGKTHPDRNAQFEFINDKVKDFQKRNQPVVSSKEFNLRETPNVFCVKLR